MNAVLPASVKIHPDVPDLGRRCVTAPADLLDEEDIRSEAMEIIRSLSKRIEVGPQDEERGY